MSAIPWEGFAGIALACMCAGYLTGVLYEAARRSRAEFNAQIDAYQQQIEANRRGRHERTAPRRTPGTALVRDTAGPAHPAPRPPGIPDGGWYTTVPARPAFTPRPQRVVTAAGNTPALLPRDQTTRYPARFTPQASRWPDTHTITGTGELRALTDDLIARIEAEGTAIREQLAADAAADRKAITA